MDKHINPNTIQYYKSNLYYQLVQFVNDKVVVKSIFCCRICYQYFM